MIARKLIDVASIAGVDAVKFQKRTVDKLAVKAVLAVKLENTLRMRDMINPAVAGLFCTSDVYLVPAE